MNNRKVHLRTAGVIQLGHTKTYCGRVIYSAPPDTTGALVTLNLNLWTTVHVVLVTCSKCLAEHQRRNREKPQGIAA